MTQTDRAIAAAGAVALQAVVVVGLLVLVLVFGGQPASATHNLVKANDADLSHGGFLIHGNNRATVLVEMGGETWDLDAIQVYIDRVGSTSFTYSFRIRDGHPGEGGNSVCLASASHSTLPSSASWFNMGCAGNVNSNETIQSQGYFYIELSCNGCTLSNYIRWYGVGTSRTTNAWSSYSGANGGGAYRVYGDAESPETPTPTPAPYVDLSGYHGTGSEFTCTGNHQRWLVQPFAVTQEATIDSVALRLMRLGNPGPSQVFLYRWNHDTPTGLPTGEALASGQLPSVTVSASSFQYVDVSMAPKVLLEPGDYALFFYTPIGTGLNCYRWHMEPDAELDGGYSAMVTNDAVPGSWGTLEVPEGGGSYPSFSFRVRGQTFAPAQSPVGVPPQSQPPGEVAGYSYTASWVNGYIGTTLVYDLADMDGPVTLQVRRLAESTGTASQVLATFDLTPDGSDEATMSWPTTEVAQGPVDVYDVTHGVLLLRHYLMPEPAAGFKDERGHRCGTSCAVGHGSVVYTTNPGPGHLHPADTPNGYSAVVTDFGRGVVLHYRVGDADGLYLSIRDANTLVQKLIVPVADLVAYNSVKAATVTAEHEASYIFIPTDGNDLAYVQNLDVPPWLSISLPPGAYNYALVSETDEVEAEGESLLLVRSPGQGAGYELTSTRPGVALGGEWTGTYHQRHSGIRDLFGQYLMTAAGFGTSGVSSSTAATQTVRVTVPSSTVEVTPYNVTVRLKTWPNALPYAVDPAVYGLTAAYTFEVREALKPTEWVQERLTGVLGEAGLMLLSLGLVAGTVAVGAHKRYHPLLVLVLGGAVFVACWALTWIPDAVVLVGAVVGGAVWLFRTLAGRGGGD